MEGYDARTYGERMAEGYDWDMILSGRSPRAAAVLLSDLAAGGPVLELGIGTGRIALALVERGIEVHGVEISPAMIDRLRDKTGGDRVVIIEGDMKDVPAPRSDYSLIFIAFNTLCQLLSQDEQVTCFRNAAARLAPGGWFAVETAVVDVGEFSKDQRVRLRGIGLDEVVISTAHHNRVAQIVESATVVMERRGNRIEPLILRYVHPSELDLMGRIAGLSLDGRFAGWSREPFTGESTNQVSLFRKLS